MFRLLESYTLPLIRRCFLYDYQILKTVRGSILSESVKNGNLILNVVNSVLSDNKKLPVEATGYQIERVINELPADKQSELLNMELTVQQAEINAWMRVQDSLANADNKGNSTRPWVAKLMAIAVFSGVMAFIIVWLRAVFTHDTALLESLNGSWALISAALSVPTTILIHYFGKRTQEKTARYAAATGQPSVVTGIAQVIKAVKYKG